MVVKRGRHGLELRVLSGSELGRLRPNDGPGPIAHACDSEVLGANLRHGGQAHEHDRGHEGLERLQWRNSLCPVHAIFSLLYGSQLSRMVRQHTVIADCLPGIILAVDHPVALLFLHAERDACHPIGCQALRDGRYRAGGLKGSFRRPCSEKKRPCVAGRTTGRSQNARRVLSDALSASARRSCPAPRWLASRGGPQRSGRC